MERVSWLHLPLRSVVVKHNNAQKYVMLCNLTVTCISKLKRLGHAQYNVLDVKKKMALWRLCAQISFKPESIIGLDLTVVKLCMNMNRW